jgi:hypothetical protein
MSQWVIKMKAILGANHLRPGRTRHANMGPRGQREFPPFVRLEIAQYPGDSDYYFFIFVATDR